MNNHEKIKNSINTLFWQYIFVAISTLIPFAIRTLIIRFWGMDYLGLNSLFSSIIRVLNLSELGIGSALIISMYKPVADGDIERTNQLLSLYAFFYKILGTIILITGCCIAPFITMFINGSYPGDINIYFVYFIYLFQTVASYWAYAYAVAAFHVNQRLDVIIKVSSLVWIFCYIMQIMVIVLCKNYYLYAVLLIVGTTGVGIINKIRMSRMYPDYKVNKLEYRWFDKYFWSDFWKRVFAMVLSKIRIVLRESIDSIIISVVLGLIFVARYQNYILVMSVPYILCSSIVGCVLPGLGNGIATQAADSNYGTVQVVSFVNGWAATVFSAFLICFFQPFISIWAGAENTLPFICEVLFCIYFYLKCVAEIPQLVRNFTGIWWEGKWVAIVESLVNLILDILFVNIWGLEGVIIATIISIGLINITLETYYVYRYYFKLNPVKDLARGLYEFLIATVVVGITYYVCQMYRGDWIGTFLYCSIICLIVPNVLLLAFHFKSKELKEIFKIGLMFIRRF